MVVNPVSGPISSNGPLAKAFLHVIDKDWAGSDCGEADFVFNFNPATVTVEKASGFKDHARHGLDSGDKEWTGGCPRKLGLGNLYFDTFEERTNVRRRYIDRLESLVHQDPVLRRPPRVLFQWGRFMSENDPYNSCPWYVGKVKVAYVLFLSDGTPVRARVEMDLVEATPAEDQLDRLSVPSGRDTEIVAGPGDTIAGIAARFLDSPDGWRDLAAASGIDNPVADIGGSLIRLRKPELRK